MKSSYSLLVALALMNTLTARAEDAISVTYNFSAKSYASSYSSTITFNGSDGSYTAQMEGVELTNGDVTLVCSTNESTTAPTWVTSTNNSNSSVRLSRATSSANGNSMKISVGSSGYVITGMTFTFIDSNHMPTSSSTAFDTGPATYSTSNLTATWTSTTQVSEVTLTNDNSTSSAWWIQKLTVTYAMGTLAWSASEATVTLGASSYSLPTLSNPNALGVTYSSSDTDVATIDSDGDISLLSAGTTTISATSTATDDYASVTVSYTLTISAAAKEESGETDDEDDDTDSDGDKFTLVTSAAELLEGDEVTIVCKAYNVCIGSVRSSGNNFAAVSVEIADDHTLTLPEAGTSYLLGLHRDGHWYFTASDSSYYLCAPGRGNNNWLRPTTTLDEYAHAIIRIDSDSYNATINFQASTDQAYNDSLLYNSSYTLFACYGANTTDTQVPVQLYKKATQAIDVTISSVGYATLYYSAYDLQVPDAVTAYTVTTDEDKTTATLTALTADDENSSAVIPAGEPVVLFSQEPIDKSQSITYSFPIVSDYTGSKSTSNELVGTDVLVTLNESNTTYYILSTNASGTVAFYWQDGTDRGASVSLDAHKCCLPVTTDAGGQTRALSISLPSSEDETDAISNINADASTSAPSGIYSLSGQRMNSADKLPAGVYVIDGKKMVVK